MTHGAAGACRGGGDDVAMGGAVTLAALRCPPGGTRSVDRGRGPRSSGRTNEPRFIVIRKSCRTLDVYRYGDRLRSYPAVFGQAGTRARKMYEGDMRTPTGLYSIIGDHWHDRWEHFFLLDYPNGADAGATAWRWRGEIPIRGRTRRDRQRHRHPWHGQALVQQAEHRLDLGLHLDRQRERARSGDARLRSAPRS